MCSRKDVEVLDYETSGRPDIVEILNGLRLSPGDHLHWKQSGLWRDGILVKTEAEDKDTSLISVIRYMYDFPRMVVGRETFRVNFIRDVVRRYEYGQYCHPSHIVLKRAELCLGYTGYNAIRNDNEDFCRWCKSGKHTYMVRNEFQLAGLIDKDETEVTDWLGILTWEDAVHGDHIAWRLRDSLTTWHHGILTNLTMDSAEITTSDGLLCCVVLLSDIDSNEIYRVLYRECHPLNCVLSRAKEYGNKSLELEDTYLFAKWCKMGIPANSSMKKITRRRRSVEDHEMQKEAIGTFGRAGTTTAARGLSTVATVAKQCSSSVARSAVEGVTAVAAIGVEAVVAGVEVGLTYKNFIKTEISKDELNKRNIITVTRSTGAAGCSIAGGVAGAAVGSCVPGVGTVIGGVVGGIIGGIGGQVAGHYSGKGIALAAARPYENICVIEDDREEAV